MNNTFCDTPQAKGFETDKVWLCTCFDILPASSVFQYAEFRQCDGRAHLRLRSGLGGSERSSSDHLHARQVQQQPWGTQLIQWPLTCWELSGVSKRQRTATCAHFVFEKAFTLEPHVLSSP